MEKEPEALDLPSAMHYLLEFMGDLAKRHL